MKLAGFLVFLTVLLCGSVASRADTVKTYGEDPFPLSCANFAGMWQSNADGMFRIEQDGCSWLIVRSFRSPDLSMTILPDNQPRKVRGRDYTAIERHHWSKSTFGTEIITERTVYLQSKIVRESVRFELVTENYIEQSIVRTIENLNDGSQLVDYDLKKYQRVGN